MSLGGCGGGGRSERDGGGVREAACCHPVTLLPELAVQLCVLQVYTRDGVIDNG